MCKEKIYIVLFAGDDSKKFLTKLTSLICKGRESINKNVKTRFILKSNYLENFWFYFVDFVVGPSLTFTLHLSLQSS